MFGRVLFAALGSTFAYCFLLVVIYLNKPGDKSGLGFVIILVAFWGIGIALGFALLFWLVFDVLNRRKRGARSQRLEAVAVLYGGVLLFFLGCLAAVI